MPAWDRTRRLWKRYFVDMGLFPNAIVDDEANTLDFAGGEGGSGVSSLNSGNGAMQLHGNNSLQVQRSGSTIELTPASLVGALFHVSTPNYDMGDKFLKCDNSLFSPDDYPDLALVCADPQAASSACFSSELGLLIACGQGGALSTSDDNGVTWLTRYCGINVNNWAAICASSAIVIVVGSEGKIATSADGITWTERSSGTSNDLSAITFDGTVFIAVGGIGTIITSPDGINWTTQTSSCTKSLFAAYSNIRTLIAGEMQDDGSPTIYFTEDHGESWEQVVLDPGDITGDIYDLTYFDEGNAWVAVGGLPSNAAFIAKSLGLSGEDWTNVENELEGVLVSVGIVNEAALLVADSSGTTIATSTNINDWTNHSITLIGSEAIARIIGITDGAMVLAGAHAYLTESGTSFDPYDNELAVFKTPLRSSMFIRALP